MDDAVARPTAAMPRQYGASDGRHQPAGSATYRRKQPTHVGLQPTAVRLRTFESIHYAWRAQSRCDRRAHGPTEHGPFFTRIGVVLTSRSEGLLLKSLIAMQ